MKRYEVINNLAIRKAKHIIEAEERGLILKGRQEYAKELSEEEYQEYVYNYKGKSYIQLSYGDWVKRKVKSELSANKKHHTHQRGEEGEK